MSMILELRAKRAKAWDAAKAFLDSKRGADGLLSAEDVATYEKMEADVVNLGKGAPAGIGRGAEQGCQYADHRQACGPCRGGKDGPGHGGIPEILLECDAEQNALPGGDERPAGGDGFRGRLSGAG